MKISSVTPTSRTRNAVIVGCIKSVVDIVDEVIILHLKDKPGSDNTLVVARDIAGRKLRVVDIHGDSTLSMDNVRQEGLVSAAAHGSDWALMLDTDERLICGDVDLRHEIGHIGGEVEAINVFRTGGNEERTKLIRLPAKGKYFGEMHEDYKPGGHVAHIPGLRFKEVGKGSGDRDPSRCLPFIEKQAKEEPDNPRWAFYRAWLLEHAGRLYDAIEAYDTISDRQMAGWVRFRAACCYAKMGDYESSLDECCDGLIVAPTHAELAWMAGIQSMQLAEYKNALSWSKMAHGLTWIRMPEQCMDRVGIRDTRAFYEGPLEVMAMAYEALGMVAQSIQAVAAAQEAKAIRISVWGEVK